eukprot:CAMPEP_0181104694 /NCGR_PEP_ID=MMETSP1071-20121207/15569_1 /TAXON_ID=35127 /ORGANISM="Thalassiosira sp., Strain NH16" /LENGTH=309 /DNA_ID=CAMNT_0023187919 /DNA_START=110 /DNA_END=1036 /DNA_ORIENTATION=-
MESTKEHFLNYRDAVIYPSDLAILDSPTAWLNDACINFQMTRLQQTQDERRNAAKEDESEQKRQKKGADDGDGERSDLLEDLFIDPSVISFLVHQLNEDDEDYDVELSNLNASWKLPQPPTSGHQCINMKKLGKEELHAKKSSQTYQRKRVFISISDQFAASRSTFTLPGGGNHWSLLLWEIDTLYYEAEDGFNALVGVGFHHFDSSRGFNEAAAIVVAKKLHRVLCASMSKNDGVADVVEVLECETPQQRNGYDCGIFALGFADALSAANEYPFIKEHHEAFLQSHFEENGGQGDFAPSLRKRIGDDI